MSIPSTVTKVPPKTNCTSTNANGCCWSNYDTGLTPAQYINTSIATGTNACTSDASSTGGYESCKRTVCDWYAAEKICASHTGVVNGKQLAWRLPSSDEIGAWVYGSSKHKFLNSITLGKNEIGLQLCSGNNYYSPICSLGSSLCPGANLNTCYPAFVWSSTKNVTGEAAFALNLTAPSYSNTNAKALTSAHSVRCVLELEGKTGNYYSFAGGGGAAGAYVVDKKIPDSIIDNCIENNLNCNVYFDSAPIQENVGKGALASNAEKGEDGASSSVIVKSGNKILWGYIVAGGEGGKGATNIASGDRTTEKMQCGEHNGSDWDWFDCPNSDNSDFSNGKSGIDANPNGDMEFYPAYGGEGGNGYILDGVEYGAGGKGASVLSSSAAAEDLNGDTGKAGYIKVSYDLVYRGAPGGGAGAGAFIKLLSFDVSNELEVKVGLAGFLSGTKGADSKIGNYIAHGGNGGQKGVPESSSALLEVGLGGIGGEIEPSVLVSDKKYESKKGANGFDGAVENNKMISIGGAGGVSGISLALKILNLSNISACGGYGAVDCYNSQEQSSANGSYFEFVIPSKLYEETGANYGTAGSGGGGGGWKFDGENIYSGKGAKGTDGYIYIWW